MRKRSGRVRCFYSSKSSGDFLPWHLLSLMAPWTGSLKPRRRATLFMSGVRLTASKCSNSYLGHRADSRSFVEDSPRLDDGSQFGGGCGYIYGSRVLFDGKAPSAT